MKLISPYVCIARNLKMKLALRLNADITCTPKYNNKIEVHLRRLWRQGEPRGHQQER